MPKDSERTTELLGRLRDTLKGFQRLIIFGHDNPDPDFLASALALKHLGKSLAGIPSFITGGGVLGRAENRTMARLLKINLTPVEHLHFGPSSAVALVDTQPGTGNNCLPDGVSPVIIIDHHPRRPASVGPLVDIRPDYGATSTIMTGYLQALGTEIPSSLATALVYGIASETMDLSRETGEADIGAYLFALTAANKRLLAQILHPKVSRYTFAAIGRALNNAFYYRNVVGARLGEVQQPDVIAQVADLLLSHERMSWAICSGFFNGSLLISARSTSSRAKLGQLMRKLVARRGTAGGHELSAGAQVDCRDLLPAERLRLEETLLREFVQLITHQKDIEPKPLLQRG